MYVYVYVRNLQDEGEGPVFVFSLQFVCIPGPRQRRDQESAPGGILYATV